MGKRPSKDSFMSTLEKQVAVTQLPPTLVQTLHPERQEIYLVSEEEDERDLAPLASRERNNSNKAGFIVGAEYNAQTTLSGIRAMVMACVNPIAINCTMFVNLFAMNAVKTTQIHSWWYEEIVRIDPAQRNLNPLQAYISVINESF
ncbi:hypothetical protein BDD12DRAFT_872548 [Trichophaea hybrida]|nr:hypothetical protein BDD12DRAFT_872548 [Trichophaea hybrida]